MVGELLLIQSVDIYRSNGIQKFVCGGWLDLIYQEAILLKY